MESLYEELMTKAIASHIGLDLRSLRWFPTILPKDDRELFGLFDVIPGSGIVFDMDRDAPCFSSTYGQLLQSQQDSFVTTIAKRKFENQEYWLTSQLPKVPKYSPSSTDSSDSLNGGSSFDYTFDSSAHPSFTDGAPLSFPGSVFGQPLPIFNQMVNWRRTVINLHFDKMVSIPVMPGGWFDRAAFTYAFHNTDWLSGVGTITWDSLFGPDGALKFICNGTLLVSGMLLEIQIFGRGDNTMLHVQNGNQATSIWPFCLDVESQIQDGVPSADVSIKITIQTPPSEDLLLAMEVVSVEDLMGG